MKNALALLAMLLLWPWHLSETLANDHAALLPGETPIEFEARSGERVDAFRGQLEVPRNWSEESGETLILSYVRFPQLDGSGGTPIIYLAGGPGGSGSATARGRRFDLFMALREFGDVIAFDQRGTGNSTRPPSCTSDQVIDDKTHYSDDSFDALYRAAAEQCIDEWRVLGVRPQDWTTIQSVGDLDALRTHLGRDKISLWGISYGSHLALAALKTMDDRIERMILASVEGLDQTVKRPTETNAYFERLQAAINAREDLRADFPDIIRLMHRVQARLETQPMPVTVAPADGEPYEFLLEKRDLQRFSSLMIADPSGALRLLDLYRAIDAGITEPIAEMLSSFHRHNAPIRFAAMPLFMDIASGIGREALAEFEIEARTALVGTQLNHPMPQLHDVVADLDLGAAFREAPISDVPTLVLTGTLDGRTYPDSQRDAVAGLSHVEITLIENAGHNLFMSSPAVTERILAFMQGTTGEDRIVIENWAP